MSQTVGLQQKVELLSRRAGILWLTSMAVTAAAGVAAITGTVIAIALFCFVTLFCFAQLVLSFIDITESAVYIFKLLRAQAGRTFG